MSRALSTNGGAVDSLKVSRRCGCSPKARQMRSTLEVEMPLCRAILRVLQWVAPARPALQRLHNDMFDLGIVDRARPLVAVRRAARRGRARQSADATCR